MSDDRILQYDELGFIVGMKRTEKNINNINQNIEQILKVLNQLLEQRPIQSQATHTQPPSPRLSAYQRALNEANNIKPRGNDELIRDRANPIIESTIIVDHVIRDIEEIIEEAVKQSVNPKNNKRQSNRIAQDSVIIDSHEDAQKQLGNRERDSRGRFIGAGGHSDNESIVAKTAESIGKTLKGVMIHSPQGVDPTIDAINEITSVLAPVKRAAGFMLRPLTGFFKSKKRNEPIPKEHSDHNKEQKKADKEQNRLLKLILGKREAREGGGGLLSSLFGGRAIFGMVARLFAPILALGAAFFGGYKLGEIIREKFGGWIDTLIKADISGKISTAWENFTKNLSDSWENIKKGGSDFWENSKEAAKNLIGQGKEVINNLLGNGGSTSNPTANPISSTSNVDDIKKNLRIKGGYGGQANAGGQSHDGVWRLADVMQQQLGDDLIRFTGFNDDHHKGTNSLHAKGLGMDFTVKGGAKKAPQVMDMLKQRMKAAGLSDKDYQLIDEYNNKSATWTGGHVHAAFNNADAAEKYNQYTMSQSKNKNASSKLADKRKESMDFFTSKGWSKDQAAGIVANIEAESSFDHTALGDNGKAYGLAQHHPDRQQGFKKLFGKNIQQGTFQEQLQYIDYELRTSENKAGNKLMQAKSADEAGRIVSKHYERPSDKNGATSAYRGQLAKNIEQAYPTSTNNPVQNNQPQKNVSNLSPVAPIKNTSSTPSVVNPPQIPSKPNSYLEPVKKRISSADPKKVLVVNQSNDSISQNVSDRALAHAITGGIGERHV